MKRLMIGMVALVLSSCGAVELRTDESCRPTGWVDRVEGAWVVIDLDDEDADELVLPASCFLERVRGGLRLVKGRVDHDATEVMRREMAEIAASLPKVGEGERGGD